MEEVASKISKKATGEFSRPGKRQAGCSGADFPQTGGQRAHTEEKGRWEASSVHLVKEVFPYQCLVCGSVN